MAGGKFSITSISVGTVGGFNGPVVLLVSGNSMHKKFIGGGVS